MAIKKGQFIELDFTGRIKDSGEIFDTTFPKDAKSIGMKSEELRPMKICVGERMLPEKFDDALENKEPGKDYSIDLPAKDAFGERRKDLVKMIPLRIFTEKGVMPQRGMMLNLDGIVVRVVSVSGGRVIADFNNPLAGKAVSYSFKINKIIEDKTERVKAFLESFLKIDPSKIGLEINEKGATVLADVSEKELPPYRDALKSVDDKAKKILGFGLEVKSKAKN